MKQTRKKHGAAFKTNVALVSSAKVPRSAMMPSRSTRIRSQLRIVDKRRAMMKVVRPFVSRLIPSITCASVSTSSRGRLVQDEDRSVAQEGPRDRQSLLLALRKRGAGFTDHRVVTLRQ
jgi:hypothetical protein